MFQHTLARLRAQIDTVEKLHGGGEEYENLCKFYDILESSVAAPNVAIEGGARKKPQASKNPIMAQKVANFRAHQARQAAQESSDDAPSDEDAEELREQLTSIRPYIGDDIYTRLSVQLSTNLDTVRKELDAPILASVHFDKKLDEIASQFRDLKTILKRRTFLQQETYFPWELKCALWFELSKREKEIVQNRLVSFDFNAWYTNMPKKEWEDVIRFQLKYAAAVFVGLPDKTLNFLRGNVAPTFAEEQQIQSERTRIFKYIQYRVSKKGAKASVPKFTAMFGYHTNHHQYEKTKKRRPRHNLRFFHYIRETDFKHFNLANLAERYIKFQKILAHYATKFSNKEKTAPKTSRSTIQDTLEQFSNHWFAMSDEEKAIMRNNAVVYFRKLYKWMRSPKIEEQLRQLNNINGKSLQEQIKKLNTQKDKHFKNFNTAYVHLLKNYPVFYEQMMTVPNKHKDTPITELVHKEMFENAKWFGKFPNDTLDAAISRFKDFRRSILQKSTQNPEIHPEVLHYFDDDGHPEIAAFRQKQQDIAAQANQQEPAKRTARKSRQPQADEGGGGARAADAPQARSRAKKPAAPPSIADLKSKYLELLGAQDGYDIFKFESHRGDLDNATWNQYKQAWIKFTDLYWDESNHRRNEPFVDQNARGAWFYGVNPSEAGYSMIAPIFTARNRKKLLSQLGAPWVGAGHFVLQNEFLLTMDSFVDISQKDVFSPKSSDEFRAMKPNEKTWYARWVQKHHSETFDKNLMLKSWLPFNRHGRADIQMLMKHYFAEYTDNPIQKKQAKSWGKLKPITLDMTDVTGPYKMLYDDIQQSLTSSNGAKIIKLKSENPVFQLADQCFRVRRHLPIVGNTLRQPASNDEQVQEDRFQPTTNDAKSDVQRLVNAIYDKFSSPTLPTVSDGENVNDVFKLHNLTLKPRGFITTPAGANKRLARKGDSNEKANRKKAALRMAQLVSEIIKKVGGQTMSRYHLTKMIEANTQMQNKLVSIYDALYSYFVENKKTQQATKRTTDQRNRALARRQKVIAALEKKWKKKDFIPSCGPKTIQRHFQTILEMESKSHKEKIDFMRNYITSKCLDKKLARTKTIYSLALAQATVNAELSDEDGMIAYSELCDKILNDWGLTSSFLGGWYREVKGVLATYFVNNEKDLAKFQTKRSKAGSQHTVYQQQIYELTQKIKDMIDLLAYQTDIDMDQEFPLIEKLTLSLMQAGQLVTYLDGTNTKHITQAAQWGARKIYLSAMQNVSEHVDWDNITQIVQTNIHTLNRELGEAANQFKDVPSKHRGGARLQGGANLRYPPTRIGKGAKKEWIEKRKDFLQTRCDMAYTLEELLKGIFVVNVERNSRKPNKDHRQMAMRALVLLRLLTTNTTTRLGEKVAEVRRLTCTLGGERPKVRGCYRKLPSKPRERDNMWLLLGVADRLRESNCGDALRLTQKREIRQRRVAAPPLIEQEEQEPDSDSDEESSTSSSSDTSSDDTTTDSSSRSEDEFDSIDELDSEYDMEDGNNIGGENQNTERPVQEDDVSEAVSTIPVVTAQPISKVPVDNVTEGGTPTIPVVDAHPIPKVPVDSQKQSGQSRQWALNNDDVSDQSIHASDVSEAGSAIPDFQVPTYQDPIFGDSDNELDISKVEKVLDKWGNSQDSISDDAISWALDEESPF